MKSAFLMFLGLSAFGAFAQDVEKFNKVLVEDVQKSIQTDNDQALKSKDVILRGPASVDVESEPAIEKDNKFEKNLNQFGSQRW